MTLTRFPVLLSAAVVLLSAGPAPAADTAVVRGRVTKIDRTSKTIVVRPNEGADVIVAVTDASRLEVGGKPATLAQVKEGRRVRVTYDPEAKTLVSLKPAVTTDQDLGREVKQALAAVKDYSFRQKDKYAAQLREAAEDVEDRIDDLEARAKDAGAEAKAKIRAQIAELRKKKGVLNERLEKVRTATAEAWDDVKSGVGEAAAELEKVLDRLFKE
jgi:hypothetical protein